MHAYYWRNHPLPRTRCTNLWVRGAVKNLQPYVAQHWVLLTTKRLAGEAELACILRRGSWGLQAAYRRVRLGHILVYTSVFDKDCIGAKAVDESLC